MSKSKTPPAKTTVAVYAHGQSPAARTLRETVESIVIAFILAFLFRTFEAEAFVIPTGSMAPTLQGRHKDIECPKCGYEYRTGASEEVNNESGDLKPNCHMLSATCPMCRYTLDVDDDSKYPSYNGDRIIVNKFAYDLSDPQRWDVVVFKYPQDAKTNYIKRLVGLPNERVRIVNGDIYTAPLGSDDFQITRKPAAKLLEIMQPVFNNDYQSDELLDAGFPSRWQSWQAPKEPLRWMTSDKSRSFETDGQSAGRVWLRYQHLLPNMATWNAVQNGQRPPIPRPSLIGDFYAYNDGDFPNNCGNLPSQNEIWVGDLALDCALSVAKPTGDVILELVKGGVQCRCQIDLASGKAKLSISGLPQYSAEADTAIKGVGTHTVSFANVDEQLVLAVDGHELPFDAATTYPSLNNHRPIDATPQPGSEEATDLAPVGIAAEGGAAVKINHLNIRRDIYYLSRDDVVDYPRENIRSSIDLQHDQFFMLGDNSPRSSDSRYWRVQNYVDRQLLIGKALFVYWPHSFNYFEVGSKKIPLPFWPNFARMRFVH